MWNYRTIEELEGVGMGWLGGGSSEQPGYSVFLLEGESLFHTYSVYARGTEMLGGSYYFLDLMPLGRQEEWEEPTGRATNPRGASPDFSSRPPCWSPLTHHELEAHALPTQVCKGSADDTQSVLRSSIVPDHGRH